ncbi:hypothetical protein ANO11243_036110 [Dothideomycetidae sp. 11243]|nr:hypothetical protein ANO11243_036110 [fungal sp. No.11243]
MFSLKRSNSSSSKGHKKSDKATKSPSLTESAIRSIAQEEGWEDDDARSEVRSKISSRSSRSDKKKKKALSRSSSRERSTKKENSSRHRESRRDERDEDKSRVERTRGLVDEPRESTFTQVPGRYDSASAGPSEGPLPMSSHIQSQFPGQFPSDFAHNAFGRAGKTVEEGGFGLAADYYGDQGQSVAAQPGKRPDTRPAHPPHLRPASSTPTPALDTGNGASAEYFACASGATVSKPSLQQNPRPPQGKPSKDSATYYAHPSLQSSQSIPTMAAGAAGLALGAYAIHGNGQNPSSSIHVNHSFEDHFGNGTSTSSSQTPLSPSRHRHRGPFDKLLDMVQSKEDIRKFEEYTEYIGVCKHCFTPRLSSRDDSRSRHRHRRRSSDTLKRRSDESLRQAAWQKSGIDKDVRYQSSSSSDGSRKRKSRSSWLGSGLAGIGLAKLGGAIWNSKHDFDDTYSVRTGHSDAPPTYVFRDSGHAGIRTERGAVRIDKEFVHVRHRDGSITVEPIGQHRHLSRSKERSSSSRHDHAPTSPRRARRTSPPSKSHSRSQSPTLGQIVGLAASKGKPRRMPESQKLDHRSEKKKGFFSFGIASASSSDSDELSRKSKSRQKSSPRRRRRDSADHLQSTLVGISATAAALAAAQSGRRPEVVAVREMKAKPSTHGRSPGSHSHEHAEEDGWESASDSESSASSGLAFGESVHDTEMLRKRHSNESLSSQSSGTGKWGWRWGTSSKKREVKKERPFPSPIQPGPLVTPEVQDSSSFYTPMPTAQPQVSTAAASQSMHDRPLQYIDPMPVADSPVPSSSYPAFVPRPPSSNERSNQDGHDSNTRRAWDGQPQMQTSNDSTRTLKKAALAGGFAAIAAGVIAKGAKQHPKEEPRVRFENDQTESRGTGPGERNRSDRFDDRRTHRDGIIRESSSASHEVVQNDVQRTSAQKESHDRYSMSGALPQPVEPTIGSIYTKREREYEHDNFAAKNTMGTAGLPISTEHDVSHGTAEIDLVDPAFYGTQYNFSAYPGRSFVPERTLSDDSDSSDSPVQSSHNDDEYSRQAEIARNAAARIVADMNERYNSPQPSQAEFFTPKELAKQSVTEEEEEAARKAALKAWVPNADVILHYTMHANDFRKSGRAAPMPRKDGVPHLGLIVPTPPISEAGSVSGQCSPITASSPAPQVEHHPAESVGKPRSDKSANRVSWGRDDTRVYEVESPHQSPKQEKFPGTEDISNVEAGRHSAATTNSFEVGESPHESVPYEYSSPYDRPEIEEVSRDGATALPHGIYRSPFYETVSDLNIALDSPGTEGAPPVRGFVEGEVDEPTPVSDKQRFFHSEINLDNSRDRSPEVPRTTKPYAADSEPPQVKGVTSKEATQVPYQLPARSLDLQSQPEDSPDANGETDFWTASSSKKGKKKREKLDYRKADEAQESRTDPSPTPAELPVATEAADEDAWAPSLSKKEKKKRDKLARRATDEFPIESTGPSIDLDDRSGDIVDTWEPPLSKKEQKKRDKLARQRILDEDEMQAMKPQASTEVEAGENSWEPTLSKKERKKRSKMAEASEDDAFVTPSETQIEMVDTWEPPLSKKELKKRSKMAGATEEDVVATPSETQIETEDAWEPPLSKKELKKRQKLEAARLQSSSLVEDTAPVDLDDSFSTPLSKKEKKKLEKQRRRSDGGGSLERSTPDRGEASDDDLPPDTPHVFGNGTETRKELSSNGNYSEQATIESTDQSIQPSTSASYDAPGSFPEKERMETDEERRARKKKARQSAEFDDAVSSISSFSEKSRKSKGKRDDRKSNGADDQDEIHSTAYSSSIRRTNSDHAKPSDTSKRERERDRRRDSSTSDRRSSTLTREYAYDDDEKNQSFLAERIENEELQSLSANNSISPTLAPESAPNATVLEQSCQADLGQIHAAPLQTEFADPHEYSEHAPFDETPKRPQVRRPSSNTAVPIRFRRPPQSPKVGTSPAIFHEGSESFGSPVSGHPDSPAVQTPKSLKISRHRSNEIRREFQPLYLVEHNRKPSDAFLEDEPLPPLPSSEDTSRASSLKGSDGYESAVEEQPRSRSSKLQLYVTDLDHNSRDEDVLGSNQTTPRATHFPLDALTHRRRVEPEFYSWEDVLREESLQASAPQEASAQEPGLQYDGDLLQHSDEGRFSKQAIRPELSTRSEEETDFSSAFVTPLEHPEPTEFTFTHSKKDKKKKAKALKLGTAIVSFEDVPERPSVEESTRRQEQDTQDAIDGLFADTAVPTRDIEGKKKSKTKAKDLWSQTLDDSLADRDDRTCDDLQSSHDALMRAEAAIAKYEKGDDDRPRSPEDLQPGMASGTGRSDPGSALESYPSTHKSPNTAIDEWSMAALKSSKKKKGKRGKPLKLDTWADEPEPAAENDKRDKDFTAIEPSNTNSQQDQPQVYEQRVPTMDQEIYETSLPPQPTPESQLSSKYEKRKANKKGKKLDFWLDEPSEEEKVTEKDNQYVHESQGHSIEWEPFLDERQPSVTATVITENNVGTKHWAGSSHDLDHATKDRSADILESDRHEDVLTDRDQEALENAVPSETALEMATQPLWTSEDLARDESQRLADPQEVAKTPTPANLELETRTLSKDDLAPSSRSTARSNGDNEVHRPQYHIHSSSTEPLWGQSEVFHDESSRLRGEIYPESGVPGSAVDRNVRESENNTSNIASPKNRSTSADTKEAGEDEWEFPVTIKSKKDKKKKSKKGVVPESTDNSKVTIPESFREEESIPRDAEIRLEPVVQAGSDLPPMSSSIEGLITEPTIGDDSFETWSFSTKKSKKGKKKSKALDFESEPVTDMPPAVGTRNIEDDTAEPREGAGHSTTALAAEAGHHEHTREESFVNNPIDTTAEPMSHQATSEGHSIGVHAGEDVIGLSNDLRTRASELADANQDAETAGNAAKEFSWTTTRLTKKEKRKAKKSSALSLEPEVISTTVSGSDTKNDNSAAVRLPTHRDDGTPGEEVMMRPESGLDREAVSQSERRLSDKPLQDNAEPFGPVESPGPAHEIQDEPVEDFAWVNPKKSKKDKKKAKKGAASSYASEDPTVVEAEPSSQATRSKDFTAADIVTTPGISEQPTKDEPDVAQSTEEPMEEFTWSSTKKSKKDKKELKKAAESAAVISEPAAIAALESMPETSTTWEAPENDKFERQTRIESLGKPEASNVAHVTGIQDQQDALNDTIEDRIQDETSSQPTEDFWAFPSTKKNKKGKKGKKSAIIDSSDDKPTLAVADDLDPHPDRLEDPGLDNVSRSTEIETSTALHKYGHMSTPTAGLADSYESPTIEHSSHPLEKMIMPVDLRDLPPLETTISSLPIAEAQTSQAPTPFGDWSIDPLLETSNETPDELWARMTKKKKGKKSKKNSLLNTPQEVEIFHSLKDHKTDQAQIDTSEVAAPLENQQSLYDEPGEIAKEVDGHETTLKGRSSPENEASTASDLHFGESGISRIKDSPPRHMGSDLQGQQSSLVSSELEETGVMGVGHAPVMLPSSELMEDERQPLLSRNQSTEWNENRRNYDMSSGDASRPSSSVRSERRLPEDSLYEVSRQIEASQPVDSPEQESQSPKVDDVLEYQVKVSKKDKRKAKKEKTKQKMLDEEVDVLPSVETMNNASPKPGTEDKSDPTEAVETTSNKERPLIPDQFRLSRPMSNFDWAEEVEAAEELERGNTKNADSLASGTSAQTDEHPTHSSQAEDLTNRDRSAPVKDAEFDESEAQMEKYHVDSRPRHDEGQSPQESNLRSPAQDVDFAATLAAGLAQSGFDSDVVLQDPVFHRRASPSSAIGEADPEEVMTTSGKKKRKGRKGKQAEENVLLEQGQSLERTGESDEVATFPSRTPLTSSEVRASSPQNQTDFDAVLAASLGAAGFSSVALLERSKDAADPSFEADESPFTMSKKKKKKEKKSTQPADDYFGDQIARDAINAAEWTPDVERGDTAKASAQVPETAPQDIVSEAPPLATVEAGMQEWETTTKKKGKKGKGKSKTSSITEVTSIEPEKSAETALSSSGKKGKKKSKRGVSYDWTADEPSVAKELSDDTEMPLRSPKGMIHTSEISQSLPVPVAARAQSVEDTVNEKPVVDRPVPKISSSVDRGPLGSWSFDVLDYNRDSGLPAEEPSISPGDNQTHEGVRDSGYDTIPDVSDRNSIGKYNPPEVIAEGNDSFEGEDDERKSVASWENWDLPTDKARSMEMTEMTEDAQARNSSPIESTTKNRTSYLFQTPPAGDSKETRSSVTAQARVDEQPENDLAGAMMPIDYVPLDSPALKRNKTTSDVGESEHGVKVTRRTETPLQSFRQRMDTGGTRPPALDLGEEQLRQRSNGQSRLHTLRSPTAMSSASAASLHRLRSPDLVGTPSIAASIISNESPTPSLRRTDRSVSGDLRHRASAGRGGSALDVDLEAPSTNNPPFRPPPTPPPNDDDMATNVYQGYGGGEPTAMSPTRAQSMRRKQSSHIMDLEARVDALVSENQRLQDLKGLTYDDRRGEFANFSKANSQALADKEVQLQEKDAQINQIKAMLDPLREELDKLTEINANLSQANRNLVADTNDRYATLQDEHKYAHEQWQQSARELDKLRLEHSQLSSGMESIVRQHIDAALEDKDTEIVRLRAELDLATSQIRHLQEKIQTSTSEDMLIVRDEDYFDGACQKLCQHVQAWVLRFSKSSDNRACRLTSDLKDEKLETRLDNCMLDGSDVDTLLVDRVRRRDIFMALFMMLIWEYVFTRYLFGMDREQRQKLKSLEKVLMEVGPPRAIAQWRAITLTLLSQRPAFETQLNLDREAVTFEIYNTLAALLPPPRSEEAKLQASLSRVVRLAIDLSIEMRTQRADYFMLPPPMPEYDNNGDLIGKTRFDANTMSERSGEYASNEELQSQNAVVRVVLFPLVMKKGDDLGEGGEEAVICPAQVLVATSKHSKRVVRQKSGVMSVDDDRAASLGTAGRSRLSLMSGIEGANF